MKRQKFYKYLAIVLLILNIGTISYFFLSAPPHPPKPGEILLSGEIGLEGNVKKKVDSIELEHHEEKRKLMKRDFKLHEKLYEQLDNEEASGELLKEIQENRTEIEEMTFEFFSEVHSLCNEKQKKKLDEIIHKSLRMITNQPPKRK